MEGSAQSRTLQPSETWGRSHLLRRARARAWLGQVYMSSA